MNEPSPHYIQIIHILIGKVYPKNTFANPQDFECLKSYILYTMVFLFLIQHKQYICRMIGNRKCCKRCYLAIRLCIVSLFFLGGKSLHIVNSTYYVQSNMCTKSVQIEHIVCA